MHIDETANEIVCKINKGISNCLIYEKNNFCSKCDEGFYPVNFN